MEGGREEERKEKARKKEHHDRGMNKQTTNQTNE